MNQSYSFVIIITIFIVIFSACTNYQSKYLNEPIIEKNEVRKFEKPYFQKDINSTGWTINIGVSLGSGIAGYYALPYKGTQNFLKENGLAWSETNVRIANGITTSLVVFFFNYYIMRYDKSIKQVNNYSEANEWVKAFNSKWQLTNFTNGEYIKAISPDAEDKFIIYNFEDLEFFQKYFPNSTKVNQVIINSLPFLKDEEIFPIVSQFKNVEFSRELKANLIYRSANIDDWIKNYSVYENSISLIAEKDLQVRLKQIFENFNDVDKFINSSPNYVTKTFLEEEAYQKINSIQDVKKFKNYFPESQKFVELESKSLEFIKNYTDEVEYKKLFPESKSNNEREANAYTKITSLDEIKLYLENIKGSKYLPPVTLKFVNSVEDILMISKISPGDTLIDDAIEKLMNEFDNIEIVKIIDSIPTTMKIDTLLTKFINNINSIDEAISASDIYPDKYEEIANRAAEFCSNLHDFRKFLLNFGDTDAAFDIRKKYFDITSENPENLGTKVNSSIGDYAPVISPDGETLYFCRRNSENPNDDEDIYYTKLENLDEWGEAQNIGMPLNNKSHNAVSGVSQDGSMLLLHNHYHDKNAGLSATYYYKDGWSDPIDLNIPNFYNESEYHNACLAADGKTILISSARTDSYGGNDLYVIRQDINGNWTEPKNLGPIINTWAEESSVFLAADGVTIYFSSDGHEGFGGSDIYLSRRLDESWTKWSYPENLGNKINTPDSERFYVIPASGDFIYYSSYNNTIGQSDIFRIGLPLDKRPNPVILVTGRVINRKTHDPLPSSIYYEDLETGEELGTVRTNPETGYYKIILPGGKKYGIRAESLGFLPINENVDLTQLKNYKKSMKDLQIVPIERGQVSFINNIFFETGKANLKKESCYELDRLYNYMVENPNLNLEVSGHTDDVGKDEMNMDLSKRRAASVCKYLEKKGIVKERLSSAGFGETKPVVPNNSASNRAKNRRVEIKFY